MSNSVDSMQDPAPVGHADISVLALGSATYRSITQQAFLAYSPVMFPSISIQNSMQSPPNTDASLGLDHHYQSADELPAEAPSSRSENAESTDLEADLMSTSEARFIHDFVRTSVANRPTDNVIDEHRWVGVSPDNRLRGLIGRHQESDSRLLQSLADYVEERLAIHTAEILRHEGFPH